MRVHSQTGESVRMICQVLGYSRSGFYHACSPTPTQIADEQVGARIVSIFREHRRRYGYRRIHDQLEREGFHCALNRVRRLMKERKLRAISTKRFVPQTSDGKASNPSENQLRDQPLPEQINQVWTGDITYIPSANGWLYLALVIDLHSRRVVGWHLGDNMRAGLVSKALEHAIHTRRPAPGLIFHSDRGSQYGSREFRTILEKTGITQSMSAKANPYENAWTESFIGTLKREMLGDGIFADQTDAQSALFAYIEGYYHTKRTHSSLGYRTPIEFENMAITLMLI